MIFKVHWIIDGVAEIEAESKADAEKIIQESLEDYVRILITVEDISKIIIGNGTTSIEIIEKLYFFCAFSF